MPNTDAKNLALWLRRWREELALAQAGELPEPLAAEVPVPSLPADVQPFDSFGVWTGDIRLLNPWLVREVRRPLYFAVLGEWLEGMWLIAPYARFSLPATVGELNTGRGESDPKQDPLAVLSLWNAHTVPPEVVQQSWFIDTLSGDELENAWEVFRHVTTGKPLSPLLAQRAGPPLYHPSDPRHDYLAEEAAGLSALGRSAEAYVALLKTGADFVPGPRETETEDNFVESTLGRFDLAIAGAAATGGAVTLKLRLPELEARVTFRQDARGERVVARVTSLADSTISHKLDGGVVMRGGKIVGKFARGRAEIRAAALAGQIGLRDRKGKSVVAEIEPST